MSDATAAYQRDGDRVELSIGGRLYVLGEDEADELLYDLEHAVWEYQAVDR